MIDTKKGLLSSTIDGYNYGKHVYYRVEFKDVYGVRYRADILTNTPPWYGIGRVGEKPYPRASNPNSKRADFETGGEIIKGAYSPLFLSRRRNDHTDPMYTSTATITLWSDEDDKYLHLTQETDAVVLYVWRNEGNDWRAIFSGVMDQSQYSTPFSRNGRYFVEFTFQEYGQLKRVKHKLVEGESLQQHIRRLLAQRFDSCGYRDDLPNEDIPITAGVQVYPSTKVLKDGDDNMDAFSTLEILLRNFGLTLMQTNNVYERVAIVQIYISKGQNSYNEPKLIPKSSDQILTISAPAKEVIIEVEAKEEKEEKGLKVASDSEGIVHYRYDLDIVPRKYPAYTIYTERLLLYLGENLLPGTVRGKVYADIRNIRIKKQTEGDNETFICLYWNTDGLQFGASFFVNYYRRLEPPKTIIIEKIRGYVEEHYYASMKSREIGENVNNYNHYKGTEFNAYYKDKVFKPWNSAVGVDHYDIPALSDSRSTEAIILTDPYIIPTRRDRDYLLNVDLKIKTGIYTNIYRQDLKIKEGYIKEKKKNEEYKNKINKLWDTRGGYLYAGIWAVDDDGNIISYVSNSISDNKLTMQYKWVDVAETLGLEHMAKVPVMNKNTVIRNPKLLHLYCLLPYSVQGKMSMGSWISVDNPQWNIADNYDNSNIDSVLIDRSGLYIEGLPSNTRVKKIIFVAFNSITLELPLGRTPLDSFGNGGTLDIEYYLHPFYLFAKDPVLDLIDLDDVIEEKKNKVKTTLSTIYTKGNTDTIKETLLYDDRLDISTTSPHRVYANSSINPPVPGATFGAFTFADLRAFEILNKKAIGLFNIEGTFASQLRRHWGLYYYKNGRHVGKYMSSMEDIDVKAGTMKITAHELDQLAPNIVNRKIEDEN